MIKVRGKEEMGSCSVGGLEQGRGEKRVGAEVFVQCLTQWGPGP